MYAVIDAVMKRYEAPEQSVVSRIYNGIRRQPGYIALPKVKPAVERTWLKRIHADYAPQKNLTFQICILHLAELSSYWLCVPDVHQRSEKLLLPVFIIRHRYLAVDRVLIFQLFY